LENRGIHHSAIPKWFLFKKRNAFLLPAELDFTSRCEYPVEHNKENIRFFKYLIMIFLPMGPGVSVKTNA
jgi:hypothetical protein